jgi:peroxin-16
VELSAQKLFGEPGRWFFIFVIQVIKCIGRLVLVLRYKNTIVKSPPIQFNRANITSQNECEIVAPNISSSENSAYPNDAFMNSYKSVTFKLKRSGRVIRKVDGAPPIYARNFKETIDVVEVQRQSATNGKTITSAEILYITKPLIHLGGSRLFGYKSWKSWCLALGIDLFRWVILFQPF